MAPAQPEVGGFGVTLAHYGGPAELNRELNSRLFLQGYPQPFLN